MFLKLVPKPWVFALLAFFVPLAVRVVPEVPMGPYVVEFDTLAYCVPSTLMRLEQGHDVALGAR